MRLLALTLAALASTAAALNVPAGQSEARVEILGCPPRGPPQPRRALLDLDVPPCGTCRVRLNGEEAADTVFMKAPKLKESKIVFTSVDGGSLQTVSEGYARNGLGNWATAATVSGPSYTAAFTPPSFSFEGEGADFVGALRNNAGEQLCTFSASFQVVVPEPQPRK